MSARAVVIACAAGMVVALSARADEPFSLRVSCKVRDYQTKKLVSVESLSVSGEEPAYSATQPGSGCVLEGTLPAGIPGSLTVNVEVAGPYQPRQVQLRRLPNERNTVARNLELFVVADGFSATIKELVRATQLLDLGMTDQALALLEREYEGIKPEYSYRQKLVIRYNYARAVLAACLNLGYDTCELAQTQCRGLSEDLVAHPDWKTYLSGVRTDELTNCPTLASSKVQGEAKERIRLTMEAATQKVARGGNSSLDGARELETLLSDQRDGRLALPRPVSSLERDAGVGFMRYAEFIGANGTVEEREQHLQQAIAHFEAAIAAGDQSPVTAMDLRNARSRLEALHQQIASDGAPIG